MEDESVLDKICKIPLPSKDVWAFYKWRDMYSVAVTYPDAPSEQDMDHLEAYMRAHAHLIPCKECKIHFEKHVNNSIKHARTSRKNLLLWLFSVHNDVNARAGKPIYDTEQSIRCVTKAMTSVGQGAGLTGQIPIWVGAVLAVGTLIGGIGIGVGIQKSRSNE